MRNCTQNVRFLLIKSYLLPCLLAKHKNFNAVLVEKNRKLGKNGTLIKMKTYNNIYEKIIDKYNIRLAHMNARKDKTFYKEVQMVDSDMDFYINEIHNMLKD